MSATTTYTCDRCGNEITDGKWLWGDLVRRGGFPVAVGVRLCEPCGDKLRAFLRGVPA